MGILCALAGSANAKTIEYTYATGDGNDMWGTGKSETYDIAIRLYDTAFVGAVLQEFSVDFLESECISDVKGWLAKDLRLESVDGKKQNITDVEVEASVSNGRMTAVFPGGYEISEDGVYVGYSFTVSNVKEDPTAERPVFIQKGKNANAFYLHSSKTYRNWGSLASDGFISPMVVTLSAELPDYSVAVSDIPTLRVKMGDTLQLPIEIANMGESGISALTYSYEINGVTGNGEATLSNPLTSQFNSKSSFEITVPAIDEVGAYDINVTIESVDGNDNVNSNKMGTGVVKVVPVVPVHRPLMEEYTYTTCGWCPRGTAAIEYMTAKYPDDFIDVSFHCLESDPMTVTMYWPIGYTIFPNSELDRAVKDCDPYFGTYDTSVSPFGIELDWNARRAVETPVDIQAEATLDEAGANVEVATTYVFVEESNDYFSLGYYLIEDDMSADASSRPNDSGWEQHNYFSGGSHDDPWIPEMDKFLDGPQVITDMHYNDVVVMYSDYYGVYNSIPYVAVNEFMTYDYKFENIRDVNNLKGYGVIQDIGKLSVVAYVLNNSTGQIVNAIKVPVKTSTALQSVNVGDGTVEATEYYDLNGVKIQKPTVGIYIKKDTYSNGAVKTCKEVAR